MTSISGISIVALTVTDIDVSLAWYTSVLGLNELAREDHNGESPGFGILLGLPDWSVLVALHVHPANGGESFSETRTGLDHVGFRVESRAELEAWEVRLTDLGVKHSPIADRDGYSLLVFRDPDEIQLMFITFS